MIYPGGLLWAVLELRRLSFDNQPLARAPTSSTAHSPFSNLSLVLGFPLIPNLVGWYLNLTSSHLRTPGYHLQEDKVGSQRLAITSTIRLGPEVVRGQGRLAA